MRLFRHEIRNQQRLFWRNRESAVFVFIFPPMLFLLLGAVYSGKIDGFRAGRRPARRADRLRLCQHGVRGPRDHARDPARERRAQAHPRNAAADGDLPRRGAVLDARRLRAADAAHDRARPDAVRREGPGELARDDPRRARSASRCFAGLGFGITVADPLGRGRLGRRQPDRAADGVPVRLVRADAPVSRGAALGRRRPAADLSDPT